jgi:hypothetical protein
MVDDEFRRSPVIATLQLDAGQTAALNTGGKTTFAKQFLKCRTKQRSRTDLGAADERYFVLAWAVRALLVDER